MLAPLQQRGATDVGDRPLAAEAQEQLIAHNPAAGRIAERVETGMRADIGHQRGDVQRLVALARDLDVIYMRTLVREDLQRGVHLIVDRSRAFMALDQHEPRTGFDDHDRARVDSRRGFATEYMREMDRLLDAGVLAHMDDDAAGHEGGVEGDSDVVARGLGNAVRTVTRG